MEASESSGMRFDGIAVDLEGCPRPVDWGELFGNEGAVEVEIGPGKGTFLLNQARRHPERNFLGIEWANQFYKYAADRMRRWGMKNVRILRTDAREFLARYIPDESVEAFHVYFPDPWSKKRHHKRRFFMPANVKEVHRGLKAGGELRIATDHEEYFRFLREVLRGPQAGNPEPPVFSEAERKVIQTLAGSFEETDFLPTDAADAGEWVGSNFERKYLKEGRAIYTLALRKISMNRC